MGSEFILLSAMCRVIFQALLQGELQEASEGKVELAARLFEDEGCFRKQL